MNDAIIKLADCKQALEEAEIVIKGQRSDIVALRESLKAVDKEWEMLKTAIKVSGYRAVTLGGELRIIPRKNERWCDMCQSDNCYHITVSTVHRSQP